MEMMEGWGGCLIALGQSTNTNTFSSHKMLATFELNFSLQEIRRPFSATF